MAVTTRDIRRYTSSTDPFTIMIYEVELKGDKKINPPKFKVGMNKGENSIDKLDKNDFAIFLRNTKHIDNRSTLKKLTLPEILLEYGYDINTGDWVVALGPCYPYREEKCNKIFTFTDNARRTELVQLHRYTSYNDIMKNQSIDPNFGDPESLYKWIGMNKWAELGKPEIVHILVMRDFYEGSDIKPASSISKEDNMSSALERFIDLKSASTVLGHRNCSDNDVKKRNNTSQEIIIDYLMSYGVDRNHAESTYIQIGVKTIENAIIYLRANFDYQYTEIDFMFPQKDISTYSTAYMHENKGRQNGGSYLDYYRYMLNKYYYMNLSKK